MLVVVIGIQKTSILCNYNLLNNNCNNNTSDSGYLISETFHIG